MISTKILLSKYLLLKARSALEESHPYSSSLAVSLSQDAVESLLWAIAIECSPNIKHRESFEGLWDSLEREIWHGKPLKLPFKPRMIEVNKARVNFKHYGQLVQAASAREHVAYAEDFVQSVVLELFEQRLEDISLANLIQRKEVRELIKAAEKAYLEERYEDCVTKCAEARHDINTWIAQVFPHLEKPLGKTLDGPVAARLEGYLQYVRSIVILSLIRTRLTDFHRFNGISPGISKSPFTGSVQVSMRVGISISKQDAEFCIDFVTTFALGIEDQLSFPL